MTLPRIAKTQLNWFTRYVRFYLKRNFHGLHLLRLGDVHDVGGRPLLVCLNHPSWWDPLVALYVSQKLFPQRAHYGPIAAAGLEKYKFFGRLGFFGIDPKTRVGAERFLQIGSAVLSRPDGAFWVTAQGHFADVRQRPFELEGGAGHLAHRNERFAMLPIALEYAFWNERCPEAFVCMGQPLIVDNGSRRSAKEWTQIFSAALEATQDALSGKVMRRDPALFEPLMEGTAGIGGVYDIWRALKARMRGKRFEAEHGRI